MVNKTQWPKNFHVGWCNFCILLFFTGWPTENFN